MNDETEWDSGNIGKLSNISFLDNQDVFFFKTFKGTIKASWVNMCILSQTRINFSNFPVNFGSHRSWFMLFTGATFLHFNLVYIWGRGGRGWYGYFADYILLLTKN